MNWKKVVPAVAAVGLMTTAGLAGAQGTSGSSMPESTSPSSPEQGSMGSGGSMGSMGTTAQMGQEQQVTLTVRDVDQANNKVTLEANLDPQATVEKNGTQATLDRVQPGDTVRASFDPNTGQITNIEVQPSSGGSQGQAGSSGSMTPESGSSGSMGY